jgi:hypothetical protein
MRSPAFVHASELRGIAHSGLRFPASKAA